MSDPLVVTLLVDHLAQQCFDALRRQHFPAGRTQVGAHVTLFHAVPSEHLERVQQDLHAAARRPAYDVRVGAVQSLGRGVALALQAPELDEVHRLLARAWAPWLTAQDSQGLRAHVTVQNKVTTQHARATLEALSAGFSPYDVRAVGLGLWRYVGGPWEPVATCSFDGVEATTA